MGEFREWLNNTVGTENVESKIDSLYDKAKYAKTKPYLKGG